MIEQISAFFSTEMIYLWLNLGVIPFWIILIFFPQSKICNYIVVSIFPFFLLSLVYSYLLYLFYMTGYNYNQNFSLYLGLDDLRNLFSENAFLLLFWIHFLGVNLFCETRDIERYFLKFLSTWILISIKMRARANFVTKKR